MTFELPYETKHGKLSKVDTMISKESIQGKLKNRGFYRPEHVAALETALTLYAELEKAEAELAELRDAVALVRKSDCGAWLKDCTMITVGHCSEGTKKRQDLMRLLDSLYKKATP